MLKHKWVSAIDMSPAMSRALALDLEKMAKPSSGLHADIDSLCRKRPAYHLKPPEDCILSETFLTSIS